MNEKIGEKVESLYSLTPLQEGMLYHYMLAENSTEYVLQNVLMMEGTYNSKNMQASIQLLAKKYEVLRTLFLYSSVEKPIQVVLKQRTLGFTETDLCGYDKIHIDEQVEKIIRRDIENGFNLEREPLFRMHVIHIGAEHRYLVISAHHIIIDGWCLSLLLHDLLYYYERLEKGIPVLDLEDAIDKEKADVSPYGDYVKWLENKDKKEAMEYWQQLLEGYNTVATVEPVMEPDNSTNCVDTVAFTIEELQTDKIMSFVKEQHITLSVFFETVWAIILQKYNRRNDIVFGKVVSGREKEIKGIEQAVGLYINTIPVRVKNTPDASVLELVKLVMEQEINSFQYDYCSISEIQKQTELKKDLFQSIFVFENYYEKYEMKQNITLGEIGVNISICSEREQTNYPLSIAAFEKDKVITYGLMFDSRLFNKKDVMRICNQMGVIMQQIIQSPNMKVKEITLIDQETRKKILSIFNQRSIDFSCHETVITLFEKQVKKYKTKCALCYKDQSMTYDQLNNAANKLGNRLRTHGVKAGDYVVILSTWSMEMIIGIIGIIKAGACYVPIDPAEPGERIEFKISDCRPKAIVTFGCDIVSGLPIISLETLSEIQEYPFHFESVVTPEDLVYMIYTSGTTGNPKGVMVEHRNLVNFCKCCGADYDVREEDRLLLFASITFDASVGQIMLALLNGATLFIPEREYINDIEYVCRFVEKEKITLISFPPQFAAQMKKVNCKLLLTAGSEANHAVVENIVQYVNYINAYGPTEATICAAYWSCKKGEHITKRIPIGKPHRNYWIYICEGNNLCDIGVPGELCIGGKGVARGYHNRKELTNRVFIDNPYGEGKMYRSGDLARWLPDGNIEFLGRIDEQVKIRGYRIELNEVEVGIRKTGLVNDCTVLAINNNYGEKCLAAFLVSNQNISIELVRNKLSKILPFYMIPDYFTKIDEIPVTINGKVDKSKLLKFEIKSESEYVAPRNGLEKKICDIITNVLGVKKVGIKDNFFELGGNSISAIRFVSALKKEHINISLGEIVTVRNAEEIAAIVTDRNNIDSSVNLVEKKQYGLSSYQSMLSYARLPFHVILLKLSSRIDVSTLNIIYENLVNSFSLLKYRYKPDSQMLILGEENAPILTCAIEGVENRKAVEQEIKNILVKQIKYPFVLIQIKKGGIQYAALSLNLLFCDNTTYLLLLDAFLNMYNDWMAFGRLEAGEARELENKEFFDWLDKNKVSVRRNQRKMEYKYTLNIDQGIGKYLLRQCKKENEKIENLLYFIINHAITEFRGSGITTELLGDSRISDYGTCPIGQFGVVRDTNDVIIHVIFEEELYERANQSGIYIEQIYPDEMYGANLFFIDVIIKDGSISYRIYAAEEISKDEVGQFVYYLYQCTKEYVHPKQNEINEWTEKMIKEEFKKNSKLSKENIQFTYKMLFRQRIFTESSFSGVCVGKQIIIGKFAKQEIMHRIAILIRRQSVLRSYYDPINREILEVENEEGIYIPYYNASLLSREERQTLFKSIEKIGCSLERYEQMMLLTMHFVVKISDYMHIVYIFSHHMVSDMVSIHIWNQELQMVFCANHEKLVKEPVSYGAFVKKRRCDKRIRILYGEEYTKAFQQKNNLEIVAISKNPEIRKQIEKNAPTYIVKLLDRIHSLYNNDYKGDIPVLYVHHGREKDNAQVMGLFINLYQLNYRHGDDSSMQTLIDTMLQGEMRYKYPNLIDQENIDFSRIESYPLVNINVAEIEYNPDVLDEIFKDKKEYSKDICFRGIFIQMVFFKNAIRLIIQCDPKYEMQIRSICKKEFDEQVTFEERR